LTAEKVIASYIEAVGGTKKIQELKSVKTTMKATIQGTELTMTNSKKAGGKSVTELTVQGNVMNKSITDGKNVAEIQMGQNTPVDPSAKEKNLFEAHFVPETMLMTMNIKTILKSIEIVDGKEAYVVEYQFPGGEKTTNYFDRETSLKVQTLEQVKTPQGEIAVPTKYQDYKDINGIKFPHTVLVSQGPMNLKFQVSGLEVNPVLEDALFKVQ
jgi:zinc protease